MVWIPPELLAHTGNVINVERPAQGEVFDTHLLSAKRGRFVLKIGDNARKIAELEDEFRVLDGLRDQRPLVPAPVTWTAAAGRGAFLFTYLDGENMLDALSQADAAGRHRLIAQFALTLRRIHSWEPGFARPIDWIGEAIRRAAANVSAGRVSSPVARQGRFRGMGPAQALDELYSWRGRVDEDTVFCHGDYCLPNILVRGERITGVVDWSAGGYADRRFDLATARWTIRHNLGSDEYVDTFLRCYGYSAPAVALDSFEALYFML